MRGPVRPTQPSPIPGPAPTPVTRELPVTQQVTATLTDELIGAPPAVAPRPTGPVDGLPPLPTPTPVPDDDGAAATAGPVGATAAGPATGPRRGLRSGALVRLGLAAAAVALLELGLTMHLGGRPLWSTVPLWAGFASLAAVAGLVGVAARAAVRARWSAARAWSLGAGGLAGLAVFWLLVVLPAAGSDRGFLLTAPLACLGAALWRAPRGRA